MERVVVTGLGAVTPVGNNVNGFWNSIVAGRGGVGKVTLFDASGYTSKIAAEVKDFNPEEFVSKKDVSRMDRFVHFAMAASIMAVKDSGLSFEKEDPYRTGVLIGSGIGGLKTIEEQHSIYLEKGPGRISPFLIPMLIINMASGRVAMHYGLKGPNTAVTTACATGSHAIGDSFKIIQRGDADVIITGGSEAAITPLGYGGFCALKAFSTRNDEPEKASRPFDARRDGFVIGEGSGVVVLESYSHAIKRGARIYAEVAGYGFTADAYHMTAPDPTGEPAMRAIKIAIKDAGLNCDEIDYINAHGTSTLLNDRCETNAIKKVFGERAYKIPVSSTKSMTGHMLGAAGGVEFIVCVLSIVNGIIPPTINYEHPDPECDLDYVPNKAREAKVKTAISNSLGFGGHNVTLTIRKFE